MNVRRWTKNCNARPDAFAGMDGDYLPPGETAVKKSWVASPVSDGPTTIGRRLGGGLNGDVHAWQRPGRPEFAHKQNALIYFDEDPATYVLPKEGDCAFRGFMDVEVPRQLSAKTAATKPDIFVEPLEMYAGGAESSREPIKTINIEMPVFDK